MKCWICMKTGFQRLEVQRSADVHYMTVCHGCIDDRLCTRNPAGASLALWREVEGRA